MLAAPFRFNILEDIAEIPLENISADDFAARFLAIVARQVPEEAQATRDTYEAAVPVDAAVFGALSKDALDTLVGVYLAAEAESMVVKPHQIVETTNTLPGERESERRLRRVKAVIEDLKAPMEGAARVLVGQAMAAIDNSFRARLEIYPKLAEKIVPLAQRGWFLSRYFGLREIDQLVHAAILPSSDALEQCISRLYEEDFSRHLNYVIGHYPERESILRPAGEAHLRGDYALSVIAFFSQIDGIFFDATKKSAFQGKHVSSLAAMKLESIRRGKDDDDPLFHQVFDLLHEIMWLSISEKLQMSYSENERRNIDYRGINRHTVLHGIAMKEYATKENSLKAFSFLSYMASFMKSDGE
jgi:hypothetical protein